MADVKQPAVSIKRIPGEPGIWVMVFGDLLIFGLFFVTFAVNRFHERALFAASQAHLDQFIGLINTLLLLTSSLAVASGLESARHRRTTRARHEVGAAMLLGLCFIGLKAVEYHDKLAAGIGPATNDFYIFYYCFTGIHLLHVVAGLGALAIMRAHVGAEPSPATAALLESCATFWHLVDILWVVLFAILYLHR